MKVDILRTVGLSVLFKAVTAIAFWIQNSLFFSNVKEEDGKGRRCKTLKAEKIIGMTKKSNILAPW